MADLKTAKSLKLLIMGSFPKKNIYGGIQQSCNLIVNSSHFSDFKLILFDSSQISNPPPPFVIRLYYAGIRFFRFIYCLLKKRPQVALIFCSDGASALEKGFMVWVCKVFKIRTFIFPRAGNLINQVEKSFFFGECIKYLFNKANVFMAQGKNWELFANRGLKFSPNRIKVIHNWTATKDLLKTGAKRKYSEEKSITKFLFVGWLEKEKGLYELLESIKSLSEKNLQFQFTFIGDGDGMNPAQKFINENQLSKKVTFKGWIANNEIGPYYKASDTYVLPSWAEGMPNALIEALSCGLASITTNIGMIPNYLRDNHNSLLINPKSSEELTIAMEKLILDKNLKLKLSKNGYKTAIKYFSTEIGLKSLSELIKKEITNE